MAYYVRKTTSASLEPAEARARHFADELREDAALDSLSVYRADTDNDLTMVAALYNAGRQFLKPFGYARIDDSVLVAHGVSVEPDARGESPFRFVRERHCTLKGVADVDAFAHALADASGSVSKAKIKALVLEERTRLTFTTAEEWHQAAEWTRQ